MRSPSTPSSSTCAGARLWGILARPAGSAAGLAVLVVVGGPQYRVGSHRQFVRLAPPPGPRRLSGAALRLPRHGRQRGRAAQFRTDRRDIRAALDALCEPCRRRAPVVVWGLCDAASAALMFGSADPRVIGIVAANPWARSDASLAATRVKHYYGARLLQRDFWRKLLRGGSTGGRRCARWAATCARRAFVARRAPARAQDAVPGPHGARPGGLPRATLLLLSANDLTARSSRVHRRTAAWGPLLDRPKVKRVDLPEADHTFSRRAWSERVEAKHRLAAGSRAPACANVIAWHASPINTASEGHERTVRLVLRRRARRAPRTWPRCWREPCRRHGSADTGAATAALAVYGGRRAAAPAPA